jgi:hypothetical protein
MHVYLRNASSDRAENTANRSQMVLYFSSRLHNYIRTPCKVMLYGTKLALWHKGLLEGFSPRAVIEARVT